MSQTTVDCCDFCGKTSRMGAGFLVLAVHVRVWFSTSPTPEDAKSVEACLSCAQRVAAALADCATNGDARTEFAQLRGRL